MAESGFYLHFQQLQQGFASSPLSSLGSPEIFPHQGQASGSPITPRAASWEVSTARQSTPQQLPQGGLSRSFSETSQEVLSSYVSLVVDTDEHDMSDGEDEDKALDDETMCECPICRV